MKVIFGLGNPEKKYDGTRHNVGFFVLDTLAQKWGTSFTPSKKLKAHIAEISVDEEKILLVKPDTYYNDTGESARAILDFYKLDLADILVIHDELMIDFGTVRTRTSGRDAGNNGIKSLLAHLNSDQFARIRIGIGTTLRNLATDYDFVLGRFSLKEQTILNDELLPIIHAFVDQFTNGSLMNDSVSATKEP